MNEMPFGTWLKREIEERELTQEQFAESHGFTLSALTKWIGGVNQPRGRNIVRLARALGMTRELLEERLHAATVAA